MVTGGQIVGRAFLDAYHKAASNAASSRTGAAAAASTSSQHSYSQPTSRNRPFQNPSFENDRRSGMTMDEAAMVLNLDKNASVEDIQNVAPS